ncbi:MAG: hypothetical protein Q9228_000971 [Teloschistes exilis]
MRVDERIEGSPRVADLVDQDYGGYYPASRSPWPSGEPGAFLERINRVMVMIVQIFQAIVLDQRRLLGGRAKVGEEDIPIVTEAEVIVLRDRDSRFHSTLAGCCTNGARGLNRTQPPGLLISAGIKAHYPSPPSFLCHLE